MFFWDQKMGLSHTSRSAVIIQNIIVTWILILGVACFASNREMNAIAGCAFEISIILLMLFYSWSLRVFNFLFVVQVCASFAMLAAIGAKLYSDPSSEHATLNPHMLVVISCFLLIGHFNSSLRRKEEHEMQTLTLKSQSR